jgi:hypothetical protein
MLRRRKTGQSTAEYAIVIGLVIAAAVAMQVYVKRGIQAKVKGAVDFVPADQAELLSGQQFEPDYSSSEMDRSSNSKLNIATNEGGEVVRTIGGDGEVSASSGTQTTTGMTKAE